MRIHDAGKMQLSDVIARARRFAWLLAVVPLLAIGAAVAVTAQQDPDTSTLATIAVIAPEGQSTAATVTQAVDGFRSAIGSDAVVRLASVDAGADISADRDVTAVRVGSSNLVDLRVDTQPGEDGQAVVEALVDRTNAALYASSLASAEARAARTEDTYEKALEDRREQTGTTGFPLPIESYRAKASEITQLRVALATTLGDASVDRDLITRRLREAVTALGRLGTAVEEYESLQDDVTRSRAERGQAAQELDAVLSRLEAARSDDSVTVASSTTESARTSVVRAAVAAAIVGLAVAGGLILMIGIGRGPSPRTAAVAPAVATKSSAA